MQKRFLVSRQPRRQAKDHDITTHHPAESRTIAREHTDRTPGADGHDCAVAFFDAWPPCASVVKWRV